MPSRQPTPLHGPIVPRFVRYASAGGVGTGVHYAVLIALVQLVDANAVSASTAGAVAGALVNYLLNHRFTFASRKAHSAALPRFAIVAAFGIVLNAIVLAAMLMLAQLPYVVAQMVATGAVLAATYLANRAWTF
jgi:putative flippase GtrA